MNALDICPWYDPGMDPRRLRYFVAAAEELSFNRKPQEESAASSYVLPANRDIKRADERTRTADLLITSVRSVVAGRCRGLQIPHKQRAFCSLHCPPLQGVACGLGS